MSKGAHAALMFACCVLFAEGTAHGEDSADEPHPAVRLVVESKIDGCPSAEAFDAMLVGLLGGRGIPPDTTVSARVRRSGAELTADLVVDVGGAALGKRELRGPPRACRDLLAATALAASLLIEEQSSRDDRPEVLPGAPAEEGPPSPPGAEGSPPPPRPAGDSPAPVHQRKLEHGRRPRTKVEASTWAGGELLWGTLPHTGVGVVAGLSIGRGNVLGLLEAASFFPSEVRRPLGAVMRVGLHVVRAGPCLRYAAFERVSMLGCISGNFGAIVGEGTSRAVNPRRYRFVLAEVGVRAGVGVRLAGPFAARLEARGAVPLTSAEFTLGNFAYGTRPWAVSMAALVETAF